MLAVFAESCPIAAARPAGTLHVRDTHGSIEAAPLHVDPAALPQPHHPVRAEVGYAARGPRAAVPPAHDSPILPRVAAGDQAAVGECLEVYGPLVWAIARRMALTPADAEDAAQEIFIDLWKSAARFDPAVASEAAFVTMIARRRAIDRRRRAVRRGVTEEINDFVASSEVPFDERIAESDEAEVARRALAELRPEQREVLELNLSEGLTHVEIAARLDMPLGTVKTHARRGLQRVRDLLDRATRRPPPTEHPAP